MVMKLVYAEHVNSICIFFVCTFRKSFAQTYYSSIPTHHCVHWFSGVLSTDASDSVVICLSYSRAESDWVVICLPYSCAESDSVVICLPYSRAESDSVVACTHRSQVNETALQLKWKQESKRFQIFIFSYFRSLQFWNHTWKDWEKLGIKSTMSRDTLLIMMSKSSKLFYYYIVFLFWT